MTSTYLTVAIPYVNAAPHLGYVYELVLADTCARARRARSDTRFVGGTDDLSLKNVLAAEAAGVPTAAFVADHARRFAALRSPFSLTFDDFVHTASDPRHAPAVTRLWQAVAAHGDLYRRRYRGSYCVGCEQFYAATELDGGRCPEHGTPTETVEEDNWFFRLSAYQDHLADAIRSGRLAITPAAFRAEALAFVEAGLSDISVSRAARRARGWGIPVPGDPDQVVYVWFDALTSYLSALDHGTPGSAPHDRWWLRSDERVHVVGRGILRFHSVFWPAFLAAAGEPGPTRVHVHPYLRTGGAKLSKSSGGAAALDPFALLDAYGSDALRWWLARDVHPVADTDVSVAGLVARANDDLAGGFANVVHRITTLVDRHRGGRVPACGRPSDPGLGAIGDAFADLDLRRGTQLLLDALGALNRDLESTAPWALARDPSRAGELDAALARHVAGAVALVDALRPVVPDLAGRLAAQLRGPGEVLPAPVPGYARIESPQVDIPTSASGERPS